MQTRSLTIFAGALLAALPAFAQTGSCPVTLPPATPFERPAPLPPVKNSGFDYGTQDLWVVVYRDGFSNLPMWKNGHRQKLFWYTRDYLRTANDWKEAADLQVRITGRRLDGEAPPLLVDERTNRSHTDDMGSMIVSGVLFPTAGCWEITGRLGNATTTFVVEVVP